MHRRPNFELLSFDLEIERTLLRLKKIKADNTGMEEHNYDSFSECQSDHHEMPRTREPRLGDCWRPMMNEEYFGIFSISP